MNRASTLQICTFQVGPLHCGVDLEHVQEITGFHELTPIPLAPDCVLGLLNLRGRVITVVDLHRRLAVDAVTDIRESKNLLVHSGDNVLSLRIDELDEVLVVERRSLVKPPRTLSARVRDYVRAVLETENQLILVLDVAATTDLRPRQTNSTGGRVSR